MSGKGFVHEVWNFVGSTMIQVDLGSYSIILCIHGERRQGMKKKLIIFPLILVFCSMVGCQNKEVMAEIEDMKSQKKVEQKNMELVRNYFASIDKGDFGIYDEIFAPDADFYSPSGANEPLSKDHDIETKKMHFHVFPDLVHTIEEIITKGDKVIVRTTAHGTHLGEHEGIPVTGNKIVSSAIQIFQIENGKIIKVWEESDLLGLFLQIGMELKPREAGK
jgi:predicted ester cyclase